MWKLCLPLCAIWPTSNPSPPRDREEQSAVQPALMLADTATPGEGWLGSYTVVYGSYMARYSHMLANRSRHTAYSGSEWAWPHYVL